MMIEKNEAGLYQREIDGHTYQFQKWGAETSLSTLIKISKIAGKPLGIFMGSVISGDESTDNILKKKVQPDILANACQALVENMDESNCISLIKKLSSENIWCDDKKIVFDSHYQDKLGHLFNVVKAAIEVQYGNFFGALLSSTGVKKAHHKIANHKAI